MKENQKVTVSLAKISNETVLYWMCMHDDDPFKNCNRLLYEIIYILEGLQILQEYFGRLEQSFWLVLGCTVTEGM